MMKPDHTVQGPVLLRRNTKHPADDLPMTRFSGEQAQPLNESFMLRKPKGELLRVRITIGKGNIKLDLAVFQSGQRRK